jgi:hypothetical protein
LQNILAKEHIEEWLRQAQLGMDLKNMTDEEVKQKKKEQMMDKARMKFKDLLNKKKLKKPAGAAGGNANGQKNI